MAQCIELMEQMYFEEREVLSQPSRRIVTRIDFDSLILCMAAFSERLERYAVKVVSEFKNNPRLHSLPVQGGLIMLVDSRNSNVLALLDSPSITEIRTAAVAGVGMKLLANKGSETVGIIGSGSEARRLLESALIARSSVKKASVYSLHYANALNFAKEMSQKLGIMVDAKSERNQVTANADILIVATNSKTPVTAWNEIPSGCHIASIGTFANELDLGTVVNSKLFVDSREGVLTEATDVVEAIQNGSVSREHIQADLSELLLGLKNARESEKDVTLFKSVGLALQDLYASSYVYDKAERSGTPK